MRDADAVGGEVFVPWEANGFPYGSFLCGYSPTLRCKLALAYSRFNFAIKLALISAGHTASHS